MTLSNHVEHFDSCASESQTKVVPSLRSNGLPLYSVQVTSN